MPAKRELAAAVRKKIIDRVERRGRSVTNRTGQGQLPPGGGQVERDRIGESLFQEEQVLLDVMYDLPSHNNLARVVVDEATIANDGKPLLMFADTPKVASAHS